MEKLYTCECGKTFTKPNSFNAHKSNCRIHFIHKYGNSNKYEEVVSNRANSLAQTAEQNKIIKAESTLDIWISEQHTCEKCGKVMTTKYGSGRFCSKSCANSRTPSEQTKQKISLSVQSNFQYYYDSEGNKYNKSEFMHRQKQIERKNKLIDKRKSIAEEIQLFESPYAEYDTVYLTEGPDGQYYYLTKHNEQNKIIKRNKVAIYRYIVELKFGRKLLYNEVVHHIDGNHFNNDPDNLQVLTRAEHTKLHNEQGDLFKLY